VPQARAVLSRVLDGKARFTPVPGGQMVLIDARTRFSRLLTGVVVNLKEGEAPDYFVKGFVSKKGEPIGPLLGDRRGHDDEWRAELEGRYEQLLREAEATRDRCSSGGRPWWDSNPRSPP
jgi:hypothetical protein